MLGVIATVAIGAGWAFVSQVELIEDDFESLIETTYICTAEVLNDCGPGNAANELALQGEDRVVVEYEDIPPVLINAVVATEDKSFFEHRGVDPGGLLRAAYQVAKQKVTSDGGSLQGGSTITQQYIKLVTDDDAVEFARKGREIVRAIKLEQALIDEEGSKQAAKEQIITRYLNRAYFGRGAYGVQAATRVYFDTDVSNITLPEAAYLAGLLKNPNTGDASEDLAEANRRRTITLGQMAELEYITAEEAAAAEADPWADLIPEKRVGDGLGEVAGAAYGTQYFIRSVRDQLDDIYPNGEYYTQSLRVYTTLDPELQRLAYETITSKLDPTNEFMPLGSLVSLDENGAVKAMMGGADWSVSQVNLATGRDGGGSGFQAGSQMKTFALAEYIEQGFSPESLYEAPFTWKPPKVSDDCANPIVRGGVTNNKTRSNHRTVYQALASSLNTVFMQISIDIGAPQLADMARKLGITSDMKECPNLVLGTNSVSPLEMAGAYANLAREGEVLAPVMIERIEDADGNVLCWYPQGSCAPGSLRVRQGEQEIEASVARQVNGAMQGVVTGGSGRRTRLIDEETETTRPSAGKTGTTQSNRDAWFTGFTCGMTTSVWVGYPGVEGEPIRFMNDAENQKNELLVDFPTMAELFDTDEYNNSRGNGDITGGEIPAELWHDFMIVASEDLPLCEELPTERPGTEQRITGQELLTTLVHCESPDPEWLATLPTTTVPGQEPNPDETTPEETTPEEPSPEETVPPETVLPPETTVPEGGGDGNGDNGGDGNGDGEGDGNNGGDSEDALGVVGVAYRRPLNNTAEEPQQPEPTPAPTAPPTTEPCIDVDLEGEPLETTIPGSPGPDSGLDQGGQGGGDQGGGDQGGGDQGGGGQDG